jgi:hypothetical protein
MLLWILLRVEDRVKTAFQTDQALFEWCVLPFGLCNAPPTFCRAMDHILGDLRTLFVILYVDDWLIATKTGQDMVDLHIRQLEALLAKLSKAGMSLKATKTHLFQWKVQFLGHIMSAAGREPDPNTVKVIRDASPPKTNECNQTTLD